MNLAALRENIGPHGREATVVLDAGLFEITSPLVFGRDNLRVRGSTQDGRRISRIKRGKFPDGRLYLGPLIYIEGRGNVTLADLDIDGARFEIGQAGAIVDHRHPLDSDPASRKFLCAKSLPEPDCYLASNHVSDAQADIWIVSSRQIEFVNLSLRDAIRIGVATGPFCRDVRLDHVDLIRAGDYGLWIGSGLPDDLRLPLSSENVERLPGEVAVTDCFFDGCGASGAFIEGYDVSIRHSHFLRNHRDFPYDDEGGQIAIDYKSRNISIVSCEILGGQIVERLLAPGEGQRGGTAPTREMSVFGIEAAGTGLLFEDLIIEGNGREAISLNGAMEVRIAGERTRLFNNHLARRTQSHPANVSITSTASFAARGALSRDVTIAAGTCENGVAVWSNGSIPDLRVGGVRVGPGCDLSGPKHSGVWIGANPNGYMVQGEDWSI